MGWGGTHSAYPSLLLLFLLGGWGARAVRRLPGGGQTNREPQWRGAQLGARRCVRAPDFPLYPPNRGGGANKCTCIFFLHSFCIFLFPPHFFDFFLHFFLHFSPQDFGKFMRFSCIFCIFLALEIFFNVVSFALSVPNPHLQQAPTLACSWTILCSLNGRLFRTRFCGSKGGLLFRHGPLVGGGR